MCNIIKVKLIMKTVNVIVFCIYVQCCQLLNAAEFFQITDRVNVNSHYNSYEFHVTLLSMPSSIRCLHYPPVLCTTVTLVICGIY